MGSRPQNSRQEKVWWVPWLQALGSIPPSPEGPSMHSQTPPLSQSWLPGKHCFAPSASWQPWGATSVCAQAGGAPTPHRAWARTSWLPAFRDPMGSELQGEHSQGLEGSRSPQLKWSQKHWVQAAHSHHRSLSTLAGLVTPPNFTHLPLAGSHFPGGWVPVHAKPLHASGDRDAAVAGHPHSRGSPWCQLGQSSGYMPELHLSSLADSDCSSMGLPDVPLSWCHPLIQGRSHDSSCSF